MGFGFPAGTGLDGQNGGKGLGQVFPSGFPGGGPPGNKKSLTRDTFFCYIIGPNPPSNLGLPFSKKYYK
jgi:hypothetical protein